MIVAIDHFTKWVEVDPLPTIKAAKVQNFFNFGVVHRFGIPHTLITVNGKQFNC